EPFSHVDLQLFGSTRGSLDIATEVTTLDAFGDPIAADYGRYTAGTAVLEAAERLVVEEREPALRLFLLLVGALRALAEGRHAPPLVLDAFLLRALSASGYALALGDCASCGVPGPHPALSVSAGGLVCAGCRPAGAVYPSAEALALLFALAGGDWAVADAGSARACREASGITAAFLHWHTERALRSLPLVERR
ncbi:MAG: DNA repair protein RecO, partial [Mycobacteriales bacterium]